MLLFRSLCLVLLVISFVNGVPLVFKESTPNGESIVSISSSDPNVEKYFSEQFSTRSGFTRIDDTKDKSQNLPDTVHSSVSIAVPGKAIAGSARSFASASTGPFLPIFAFPINPEFGFYDFPDLKTWIRNVESFYNPHFADEGQVSSATAINDNGRMYAVTFNNRDKTLPVHNNKAKQKSQQN